MSPRNLFLIDENTAQIGQSVVPYRLLVKLRSSVRDDEIAFYLHSQIGSLCVYAANKDGNYYSLGISLDAAGKLAGVVETPFGVE